MAIKKSKRRHFAAQPIFMWLLGVSIGVTGALALATRLSQQEFTDGLNIANTTVVKPQILARDGSRLSVSLQNSWNITDNIALDQIPLFLQHAFILSEDQHFYTHRGVDWRARGHALWQNIKARAAIRGASTITEQVVRMLHPRPRTLWSRWVEGFEARRLESQFGKAEILDFYLNQIPYSDRRRGVEQAARLYFDRDLNTLTQREMLALTILVRSPAGMDLRRKPERAKRAIDQLAQRMLARGDIAQSDFERIRTDALNLNRFNLNTEAGHFINYVLERNAHVTQGSIRTTLDPWLQNRVQQQLDASLRNLVRRKVRDGAVLVIDHTNNQILAWAVSHDPADDTRGARILGYDSVLSPRQPGSTMKPLLYALALEKGWTAATLIDDSELSESIGGGLHTFRNYSRTHYGPIRLREALANSLNVPAVKTLKFVGHETFLNRLHAMGVKSLTQHADFYGDGLALGNGEISLFEMAQAYTVLARRGRYLPLSVIPEDSSQRPENEVFSPEIASLIGNILADPAARQREFGSSLQFPVETAIKTGTSSDYRDAWAIAFDYEYTVAVWMGNLDNTPTQSVTGAVGPALLVRSIFSELNRNSETRGLYLSSKLVRRQICSDTGNPADAMCPNLSEWFVPDHLPESPQTPSIPVAYRLQLPTPGMLVAHDPHIPAEFEALTLAIADVPELRSVEWIIDGKVFATTSAGKVTWPLIRGPHEIIARITNGSGKRPKTTESVRFYVK